MQHIASEHPIDPIHTSCNNQASFSSSSSSSSSSCSYFSSSSPSSHFLLRLDQDCLREIFLHLLPSDLASIVTVCRIWPTRDSCFERRLAGSLPAPCKVSMAFLKARRTPLRKILNHLEIPIEKAERRLLLQDVHAASPLARRWTIRVRDQSDIDWYFSPQLTHLAIHLDSDNFLSQREFQRLCTAIVDQEPLALQSLTLVGIRRILGEGDSNDASQESLLQVVNSAPHITSLGFSFAVSSKLFDKMTRSPNILQLRSLSMTFVTINSMASQALSRLTCLTHLQVHRVVDFTFLSHLPALQLLDVEVYRNHRGRLSRAEADMITRSFQTSLPHLPASAELKFPSDLQHALGIYPQLDTSPQLKSAFTRCQLPFASETPNTKIGDWDPEPEDDDRGP